MALLIRRRQLSGRSIAEPQGLCSSNRQERKVASLRAMDFGLTLWLSCNNHPADGEHDQAGNKGS
ncbi:MAG: hypothetical protein KKA12_12465 [Alphaproteobacteria bacterium]|nr:hypothetical protein [Alphaproteobacteria bacterium]